MSMNNLNKYTKIALWMIVVIILLCVPGRCDRNEQVVYNMPDDVYRTIKAEGSLSRLCGISFCRNWDFIFETYHYNMNRLVEKIMVSKLDGTLLKLIETIGKYQLLILDDFGLQPMDNKPGLHYYRYSKTVMTRLPLSLSHSFQLINGMII